MTPTEEPLDLAAIQARADAATSGPWEIIDCTPCRERGRLDVIVWGENENVPVAAWSDDDSYLKADAEFIAAAREDIPALLARVRTLVAERDEARALVKPALEQGMEAVRQKKAAEAKLAQVRSWADVNRGHTVKSLHALDAILAQLDHEIEDDPNSRSHFSEALHLGHALDKANRRLQELGQPIVGVQ